MDQISTLERLFRYKAQSNEETVAAMRQFDDTSPARAIAITVLSHTYVVDRIFAANLTGAEHGYTSANPSRSEEHTSELQSHLNLVCRLLLEKKKPTNPQHTNK